MPSGKSYIFLWLVFDADGNVLSGWPDEYAARHAQQAYEEETKQTARVVVASIGKESFL